MALVMVKKEVQKIKENIARIVAESIAREITA